MANIREQFSKWLTSQNYDIIKYSFEIRSTILFLADDSCNFFASSGHFFCPFPLACKLAFNFLRQISFAVQLVLLNFYWLPEERSQSARAHQITSCCWRNHFGSSLLCNDPKHCRKYCKNSFVQSLVTQLLTRWRCIMMRLYDFYCGLAHLITDYTASVVFSKVDETTFFDPPFLLA